MVFKQVSNTLISLKNFVAPLRNTLSFTGALQLLNIQRQLERSPHRRRRRRRRR